MNKITNKRTEVYHMLKKLDVYVKHLQNRAVP